MYFEKEIVFGPHESQCSKGSLGRVLALRLAWVGREGIFYSVYSLRKDVRATLSERRWPQLAQNPR